MESRPNQRLVDLFAEVVDIPPAERREYLEHACPGDSDLRHEVESLISSYRDATTFFADLKSSLGLVPISSILDENGRTDPYGLVGKTMSHYRIEEHLGGGGMGVVYRARDLDLQRDVALKFLPPDMTRDESAVARFKHEAIAASSLDHENIAVVHEVGRTEDGRLFIAMRFYGGETLKKKIDRFALPPESVVRYVIGIASALREAHRSNIVHRDIKPANVMVTQAGKVKLLDFGVAKVADLTTLTAPGAAVGTLAYMSPEQLRGEKVDGRTDIWSVGVVLYEMLTGLRPFTATYKEVAVYQILNSHPQPPDQLRPGSHAGLSRVTMRCLAKDPDERYQDFEELLSDLEPILDEFADRGQDREDSWTLVLQFLMTRRRTVAVVLLGILALLIGPWLFRVVWQPTPDEYRIVVQPFDALGTDDTVANDIAAVVTAKLLWLQGYDSRVSTVAPLEVGGELRVMDAEAAMEAGATHLLEGAVREEDGNVRVSLELMGVDAQDWSSDVEFEVSVIDPADVDRNVTTNLVSLLRLNIEPRLLQSLQWVTTSDASAYYMYTRAQVFLHRSEEEASLDNAISLLRHVIRADTSFAMAWAALGEAYIQRYRMSGDSLDIVRSEESGARAALLDPENPDVRVALGRSYASRGSYEEAERQYLRALRAAPENAAVHEALGWVYYAWNQLDKAESELAAAVELEPGHWRYHNSLGRFYHFTGQHEKAIEPFRRVIELRPDYPWGYNNLGAQYSRLLKMDEAIDWYMRATRVNTRAVAGVAQAYRNVAGIHYSADNFEAALPLYREAAELAPDNLEGVDNVGNCLHWLGQEAAAGEAWIEVTRIAKRSLGVDPTQVEALNYLMEAEAKLGWHDRARSTMQRFRALERLRPVDLLAIAKVYEILGVRDSALVYVESSLEAGATAQIIEASVWLDRLRQDVRYTEMVQRASRAPGGGNSTD